MTGTTDDSRYVGRTVRTACLVAGFVVFVVGSYRQTGAIVPYLSGFALSVLLLYTMEKFIRWVFDPKRLNLGEMTANKGKRGGREAAYFLGFGMIKYPLIALFIGLIVRHWNPTQLMVFSAGFLTLHLVIGLRALGKALTPARG